jgi:RNA polymerase sigma factor (sigma-70 family)
MSPLLRRRLSDEQLTRRLASGEAAAFDELYRRYAHRLAAFGGRLLGDGATGEDVAQAALLNAYQALRRGHTPVRFRPWLYRIAQNAALDMLARRRELSGGLELEERGDRPHERADQVGALVEALGKLPERQRRAYLLREVQGLRIAEIAERLALSSQQVEQAIFAARNRLAEALVFGDALDCVTLRRLRVGELDGQERRAVRRHLRSCPSCRAVSPVRARLGLLPLLPLDWARGSLAGLLGGSGSPVAAKAAAAVVATAAVGASVPIAAHELTPTRPAAPPRTGGATLAAPAARRTGVGPAAASAPELAIVAGAPLALAAERFTRTAAPARNPDSPDPTGRSRRGGRGPSPGPGGRKGPRPAPEPEPESEPEHGPGPDPEPEAPRVDDDGGLAIGDGAAGEVEAPPSSDAVDTGGGRGGEGPSGGGTDEPAGADDGSGSSGPGSGSSSSGSSGPGSGSSGDDEPDEEDESSSSSGKG